MVPGQNSKSRYLTLKGSPDPSHYIFEISVGKRRIRHRTTLNLNLQAILSWCGNSPFNFRFVICRIRLFPTLISKIKWLWSTLPLTLFLEIFFGWTYDMYLNNRYYDNNYFKRVFISNTEYQTIYFSSKDPFREVKIQNFWDFDWWSERDLKRTFRDG